jgi:hypothetical protein
VPDVLVVQYVVEALGERLAVGRAGNAEGPLPHRRDHHVRVNPVTDMG